MPSPDKLSLHQLYDSTCPGCGGHIELITLSETENDELQKTFNKVARWIFRQKKVAIQPDDLDEQVVQPLITGVNRVLLDGFNRGIEHVVPYVMKRDLRENIYLFSGAKTYAELKELSEMLMDGSGNIKPFSTYWKEVQQIHKNYNQAYLEAEYLFATQSARMAARWHAFEVDGDYYNLQYRTANDDRVRYSHQILHNTTLPPSDPFWEKYFPPNGWRCRCTVVQVRKKTYRESDSHQAQLFGSRATDGKEQIFRFNPGKQKVIFPKHHPYLRNLSNPEKKIIQQKAKAFNQVKTKEDVISIIKEINQEKQWFQRGFIKVDVTRKRNLNGSTDMDGRIWLTKERLNKTTFAIDKLQKGEEITFDEADALSTFWHEITHNRNKVGMMRMTKKQTRYMELANEFVSRNTLSEFYAVFGSKVQHPELMVNRKSTGYNRMVKNYQRIIEKTGLKKQDVIEKVKVHLFNEKYTEQRTGLTNALKGAKKRDGTTLSKTEIISLVSRCDIYTEKHFDEFLDSIIH